MKTANFTFAIFLFLSFSNVHAQTSHYVSKEVFASNSKPGTFSEPWATINHAANSTAVQPGDTVFIKSGTYNESIWLTRSGTAGNYITFTNYNADEVIIDGSSTGLGTGLFFIVGQNYVRIEGLHFTNATGPYSSGVNIREGSSNIEILNNKIHDIHFSNNASDLVYDTTNVNPLVVYNEFGMTACQNITISGNEIYDCRTGFSEALTLNGNVDGFEVSGNMVHDITNIGIVIAGGYGVSTVPATDMARNGIVTGNTAYNCVSDTAVSAGIYVDGGHNVTVERNISYANGRGFQIGCERLNHTTDNVIVRNNLSYNNLEEGMGIGGYNYPSTGKVINSHLLNNSCYNNNTSNMADKGELIVEYTENCSIKNNIFYAANTQNYLLVARLPSTGLSLNYNNYYHAVGSGAVRSDWQGTPYFNFSDYQSGTNQDLNSPFGDPMFANIATSDLHLTDQSTLIDAGDPPLSPAIGETDFDGQNRQHNLEMDIGADEVLCPANLLLSGIIPSNDNYQISGEITVDGTVENGFTVTGKAASFTLGIGFSVELGAVFSAVIEACSN